MATVDVRALLGHLGIRAQRQGPKWVAVCPNPHHEDHDPSWSIIDNPRAKKHGSHHCQACKFGGGPWELAAAVWGCDLEEAGRRLSTLFGTRDRAPLRDLPRVVVVDSSAPVVSTPFGLPAGTVVPGPGGRWYEPALRYLEGRGLTRDQIDRWGLGYAVRGRLRNRVVLPVRDGAGALLTYTARAIDTAQKPRYRSGEVRHGARPRRALWGEERWAGRDAVTIAEGIFGGLRLEAAGAPNPTALLGSELTEEKARVLAGFRRILVATDPDKAGEAIARRLSVLARHAALVRVDLDLSPDDTPAEDLRQKIDRALLLLV